MPPPLVYTFSGEGHKPGLWCREVCHKPQEHEFAPPPWMRHSQSWNKDLLDFHQDPEPNIPIPLPHLHPKQTDPPPDLPPAAHDPDGAEDDDNNDDGDDDPDGYAGETQGEKQLRDESSGDLDG